MSDPLSAIILGGIILLLIIASAFFSSAETALTAASEPRIRQLAKTGNKQAIRVEKLRHDREKLISTILIGNNAVNVLASAIATSAAISLTGDSGVVLATLFMTVLLVLCAEVLPKSYAFNHADKFSLRIALTVQILVFLLTPLSWAVRSIVVFMLGTPENDTDKREEELRGLIDLHVNETDEEGRETGAMLASVLDFGEVTVEEIMTHRASVSSLSADDDPEQILRFVLTSPHTRHPVYSGKPENIIGVLHVKALLRAIGENDKRELGKLKISDIATEPYFIPETTQLFDQLQAFRSRREHFAIVVDEYGDLRGIVTLEDILEEIVGDIDDEHDIDLDGCRAQPDGSFIVDGNVTIRDLNRTIGLELPDEQAATIAGLIIYESRHIPFIGQEFKFHNMHFRVRNRIGNQITSLRLWQAAR
ncbi:MAG: HlyC/CorC family transporter [Alphaproteobacteria bacterium]|nr:HlyC/CorC family transporter [Alphaproteobacteria bacterium]